MCEETSEVRRKLTISEKMKLIRSNITVEPLLAFHIIPSALSMLATQNLFIEKACRVNLAFSPEICDALSRRDTANYTAEEKMVQEVVAGMAKWRPFIQNGIPFLLILFWGSWSDRHGRRKPCILLPLFGEFLAVFGLVFCTYFENTPMEVAAITDCLIPALCGGWSTMFMGIFSYVSDVTTVEDRTIRIGIVNLCFSLGVPIGTAFSGILLKYIGFYGVFSVTSFLQFSALCYGLFYLKEPKVLRNEEQIKVKSGKALIVDFFNWQHVIQTFNVAFKHGSKQRRWRILTLFIVFIVVDGPLYGEWSIFYLFVRYKFNWSEVEYSLYSTYTMLTGLVGTSIAMSLFSHKLKMEDSLLGALSNTSKIISSFVFAFAVSEWQLYIAPLLEMLHGASFIVTRSIATKLVGADEIGRMNSLFGVIGSLVPLVYVPSYSAVYVATIHVLPGAVFLLGAAMTVPGVIMFLWMYSQTKRESMKIVCATELEEVQHDTATNGVEESQKLFTPAPEFNENAKNDKLG